MEFRDLEAVAEQDLSLMPAWELEARTSQYQDAIPEEILDLLEEAVETYDILAPALPPRLQNTARKEIDFLISLYENKIKDVQSIQHSK
jgi:hypothetical protein